MDCRLECAARTIVRMECIAIQGMVHGLFNAVLSVFAMPCVPFFYVWGRMATQTGNAAWLKRIALSPIWLLCGIWFAFWTPIMLLVRTIADMVVVLRAEWVNRWMSGIPKNLDGTPMDIPTEEEQAILDAVIQRSVIRDYNEEAKRYGQGIDIPPVN